MHLRLNLLAMASLRPEIACHADNGIKMAMREEGQFYSGASEREAHSHYTEFQLYEKQIVHALTSEYASFGKMGQVYHRLAQSAKPGR